MSNKNKIETDAVIILGAGLAGSLLACYLAKRGFKVHVYERRDDMRKTQMSAGKSINLALSERGLNALQRIGLKDEILKIAIPMRGRMMHSTDGKQTFQPYSKDEKTSIYSVSRGELNWKMMDLAERNPNVKIFFNYRCTGVDLRSGEASFKNETTKESLVVKGLTVFGSDGAFSAARTSMMNVPRFDYNQTYLSHGYKELHIPPGPDGKHQFEKNYLHIWPRGSFMMIGLPNMDGSFTCTCFFPWEGQNGFSALDNAESHVVESFFKKEFGDAVPVMPTLLHDFKTNPTSALVTIRCFPWSVDGKVCLLGDASHAVVPFFGQGMNCAFEDVACLDDMMQEYEQDWPKIFAKYQVIRKDNADAIADMALENFVEMRDKVADAHFLFRKKVHNFLGNHFPERFISRYEMVSFTRIPYKEAKRLGEIADNITTELIKDIGDDVEKIDLKKAKELIYRDLPPLQLVSHSNL